MLDPLPMNTAFVYPFPIDRKALEATMDTLLSSWTTFADYKNEPHTVRTETNEMTSRSGHLANQWTSDLFKQQYCGDRLRSCLCDKKLKKALQPYFPCKITSSLSLS